MTDKPTDAAIEAGIAAWRAMIVAMEAREAAASLEDLPDYDDGDVVAAIYTAMTTASPITSDADAADIAWLRDRAFCTEKGGDEEILTRIADRLAALTAQPGAELDVREYLLLASYCGDDNPACTETKPCADCLAMCNVFDEQGTFIREFDPLRLSTITSDADGLNKRLCDLHTRLSLCFQGATGEPPPRRPRFFEPKWEDMETVLDAAVELDHARAALSIQTISEKGMREALTKIASGSELGKEMFEQRVNERKGRLTWYAVNVLQDNLDACEGTASAALLLERGEPK